MSFDHAASLQGVVVRICRLDATGLPITGTKNAYATTNFSRMSFNPEYEAGDEFIQKGADGTVCVTYKANDTLKRVVLQLATCDPDPDFTTMLCGGSAIVDGGANTVGYASTTIGVDGNPYGVGLEVWSKAIVSGRLASPNPYYHWVFPSAFMRPGGDRVFENGVMANTFEGFGVGSNNFGDGPVGDWPYASTQAYQYARVASAPTGTTGFITVI